MLFDTHTHLVYEIDDGARSIEESEELIHMAAGQGAVQFLATPHYYPNRPTNPEEICSKVEKLQKRLQEHGLDYQLYPGNEILYFDSMIEKLRAKEALTLAGSSYVLVEFYPMESYQTILKAVRKLRGAGYRPVIAHAERYAALHQNGLEELIYQGAYIQLSTQPVSGFPLQALTRFCRKALKNGEVHFLGTDMHRSDKRPPVLRDAVKWIERHVPDAEDVLYQNAQKLVQDMEL